MHPRLLSLLWACLVLVAQALEDADSRPNVLHAYRGTTPTLDGTISPGEWDDAETFRGVEGWVPEFAPVEGNATGARVDLAIEGWVKHDGAQLYFGFQVQDDLLYGFQTPRWLPGGNPSANNLTQQGWPWFGDEMEILLNPSNSWESRTQSVSGNGSSWQMVCNLGKSRLGGIGVGGLLEGEPRSSDYAWSNYQAWIEQGAQRAATTASPGAAPDGGSIFVFEWAIRFDPCVELRPGVFYDPAMGPTPIGINIALGDVDTPEEGDPVYGLRHEMWTNGTKTDRTMLYQFGTLWLEPNARNGSRVGS
jgi:SSS family solute:Na+ symporter